VILALKPNTEPIPGYQVTERLGTGGYGEVWKAEAPGGLQKAIKFIYGYLSDEKATRELKALQRIKEIRHPFLLSLERIEIVDGQLLIVTELADASLKDRFQACLDAGMAAIPRDELLAYLHDAADALDFLSEKTLQHLDVKPENLLLVGGRMKVADFGLLKEITDRTCSMMGGMTPVYAAPELFDGRPSATSDQYSLAIVYQEMLTAALPFPGATAAQLAAQHLHSRPRLESLPPSDIDIIAKALAKNPQERFSSCRELIDALMGRGFHRGASHVKDAPQPLDDPARDTKSCAAYDTSPLGGGHESPLATPRRPIARTPPPGRSVYNRPSDCRTKTAPPPLKGPLRDLPPMEVQPGEVGLRPTLFVGIGGTAGFVLRRLRRRLHDRFGSPDNVPVLQMLLMDTDQSSLAPRSEARCELKPAETLALPLRKPQHYREESLEILQWLSRRWLYNIPRSLRTEGLRPLGRLALIDHAGELFARLREALATVVAPASIEKSQQTSGLKLRNTTPRVFVIASISGGTGSGMVLDVAYILRMLMEEMGISDAGLCSVLAHSTQRNASAKDLAVANAYACLSELRHFAVQNYPGEPACGVRAFEHEPTLPQPYFVHLGDRLTTDEFISATDSLAEYLYLDAATAGGAFFDKCRAAGADDDSEDVHLRTLGVCQLGCSQNDLPAAASEFILRQIVERWANGAPPPKPAAGAKQPRPQEFSEEVSTALALDTQALVKRCEAGLEKACPPSILSQLATALVRQAESEDDEPLEKRWATLVLQARQSLGLAPISDDSTELVSLKTAADAFLNQTAEQLAGQITNRVVLLANDPATGLKGALAQCERLSDRLRKSEQEINGRVRGLQDQLAVLSASPEPATANRKSNRRGEESPVMLNTSLATLLDLFVEHKSLESAARLAGALVHKLLNTAEWLMRLRRETLALAGKFDASDWSHERPPGADDDAKTAVENAVKSELAARLPALTTQLERRITEEVIRPRGGLFSLLSESGEELRALPTLLRSIARRALMEDLRQIDIAKIVLGADAAASPQTLQYCVKSAWPSILKVGGDQRLLLMMPEGSSAERVPDLVAKDGHEKPTVLFDSDCDVVACYEAEHVRLENLAAFLTHNDPHYAEVARRLHTRVDVEWTQI
jgi:serine/threonine protein kinase